MALADYLEDTRPALVCFAIRCSLFRFINEERFADEIGAVNKTPVAAVKGVVAVVAEHEILARRNYDFAVLNVMFEHVARPGCYGIRQIAQLGGIRRRIVARWIWRESLHCVRLVEFDSVAIDHARYHQNAIAADADYALHKNLLPIDRIVEDDNIASCRCYAWEDAHKDAIADQQSIFHCSRRH